MTYEYELKQALKNLVKASKNVLAVFDDNKSGGSLASDLSLELMHSEYLLSNIARRKVMKPKEKADA